jgi:hypothetical protein
VVAEPALDLNGIAAFREQDRGAGVTEGVEANPRKVRILPSGLEYSPEDIALADDHQVLVTDLTTGETLS